MSARRPAALEVDALLDAWQAAWSGRDRRAFADVCTPDVHYEDPLTGEPCDGLDALADHAARLWSAFPDVRVETTGARLHDDRFVAAPMKVLGHHRGEVEDLPPTQRFVIVHAVCYAELDDRGGRIFRARAFFDAYDAAVQLGVLPRRGTRGEKAMLMLRGFGLRARGER